MGTKQQIFKTNTQRVFRQLLEERGTPHCAVDGVSISAANRLYHGFGSTSPKVIDRLLAYFGEQGKLLVKAWLEDKAQELKTVRSGSIKVSVA